MPARARRGAKQPRQICKTSTLVDDHDGFSDTRCVFSENTKGGLRYLGERHCREWCPTDCQPFVSVGLRKLVAGARNHLNLEFQWAAA